MREARFRSPDGALLEFLNLSRRSTGQIWANVTAYAPDQSVIGHTDVEMTNSESRKRAAQHIASMNGANSEKWERELTEAAKELDQLWRDESEQLTLESLKDYPEPGPMKWLLEGLIPLDFPSNLYGDSDSTKSIVAMYLAVCVTQGLPFLGLPVTQGAAFYLDWELQEETFARRLYPICRGLGLEGPPDNLLYARLTEPLSYHLDSLIDESHRLNPVVTILDSIGPAVAADPNDAQAMILLNQQIRKLGHCALMIDHQSKGLGQSYRTKTAIGSGYKQHLVRGGIQLELASSAPGRASVVARNSKHNFTYRHEPIAFHVLFEKDAIRLELGDAIGPDFVDADTLPLGLKIQKVLEETAQPVSFETLMDATNASGKQVVKNALGKLKNSGVPIKTIKGAGNSSSYYLDLVTSG